MNLTTDLLERANALARAFYSGEMPGAQYVDELLILVREQTGAAIAPAGLLTLARRFHEAAIRLDYLAFHGGPEGVA